MDLATRKRFLSGGIEAPAAKMAAVANQDQLMSFADIMTFQLLNAITNTEQSQRASLLDDLILRMQWLKQQQTEQDAKFKKPLSPDKQCAASPIETSNHAFDPKQMQINIQKQIEMLQSMAKIFRYSAQISPFPTPPVAPPPKKTSTAAPVTVQQPPPVIVQPPVPAAAPHSMATIPSSSIIQTPKPSTSSVPSVTITSPEVSKTSPPLLVLKKPDAPQAPKQQMTPPTLPTKQMVQSAEEHVIDLQNKQRKLLGYIHSAHGGNVTDEMLHDYLKHSYVLLKENGVVRRQPNPFFHLMTPPVSNAVASMTAQMIPPPVKMMNPTPTPAQKPVKSETPIPGPPVLVPQVELPHKKELETPQKGSTSPNEKVSPPPRLAPQAPLHIPVPFEMPTTRPCNQWSVFSMALPLRLLCRCYPRPCTCQMLT